MTTIFKSWRQLAAISSVALLAACSSPNLEQQTSRPISESYNASFGMTPAGSGNVLATSRGITLYTYDRDYRNKSNCYGECAANWPPFLGHAASTPTGDLTLFTRSDGTRQWAHSGQPLYTFVQDTHGGEINGDDYNDAWHVVGDARYQAASLASDSPHKIPIKATPSGNDNLSSKTTPTTVDGYDSELDYSLAAASSAEVDGGL